MKLDSHMNNVLRNILQGMPRHIYIYAVFLCKFTMHQHNKKFIVTKDQES
jgi:hypothetical protein